MSLYFFKEKNPSQNHFSSRLRRRGLLVLRPLDLRVQEDAAERDGRPGQRSRAHRVPEHHDRRDDHDHALDTVADRVRHGADARQDHVRDLLVGVEARSGGQGLLDHGGRVGDAGGGEGRRGQPNALPEQGDRGEEREGEDGDDREEVDVVLFRFELFVFFVLRK